MPPLSSTTATVIPPDIGLDMARVLNRMLDELRGFVESANGLPDSEVILISLNIVPIGMGNFLGEERPGPLGGVELKGGRLEGVVRFVIWRDELQAVNDAMLDLQTTLLSANQLLSGHGFLHFKALTSSNPTLDSTLNAWSRTADYSLLYEYRFEATDAADSLIVRIPVHVDQEELNSSDRETLVVTDEITRWDETSAPILSVRGPVTVGKLVALVFTTSMPTGSVTLTRTFDGAAGQPTEHATLTAFLAALADPAVPQRHARLRFGSFTDFLSQFSAVGDPLHLGDWNLDNIADEYQGFELAFDPAVRLAQVVDRLELTYDNGNEPLDRVAVIYLRLQK